MRTPSPSTASITPCNTEGGQKNLVKLIFNLSVLKFSVGSPTTALRRRTTSSCSLVETRSAPTSTSARPSTRATGRRSGQRRRRSLLLLLLLLQTGKDNIFGEKKVLVFFIFCACLCSNVQCFPKRRNPRKSLMDPPFLHSLFSFPAPTIYHNTHTFPLAAECQCRLGTEGAEA